MGVCGIFIIEINILYSQTLKKFMFISKKKKIPYLQYMWTIGYRLYLTKLSINDFLKLFIT